MDGTTLRPVEVPAKVLHIRFDFSSFFGRRKKPADRAVSVLWAAAAEAAGEAV
jgi:hypothetical protein